MPAIDTNRNVNARPAPAKKRVKRASSAPSKVQIRQARAQEQQYASQGKAVKTVARQQRQARVTRRARARVLPKGFRTEAPTRSEGTASAETYRKSDAFVRDLNAARKAGFKGASKKERERLFGPTGGLKSLTHEQRRSALKQEAMGLGADTGSKLYGNILKDTKELVTGTPASVYLTGRAVTKAAHGDTSELKALGKSFKEHDPIALAVQGRFKEAGKAAFEHPVTTGLEISGGVSGVGRGLGAALRHAPSQTLRRAGSTERAPLRLYAGSKPGEGPQVARRYSKDVIRKGAQVANERRLRRKGIDPNVARVKTRKSLVGGESKPLAPSIGPLKNPLDERVDRHVHAGHIMQQQVVRQAERKAKKRGHAAEPVKPDVKAERRAAAKPITEKQMAVGQQGSFGPEGLSAKAVAAHAHDVLGIEKPIVTRIMPASRQKALTEEMGNAPRAYTQDMGNHYRIDINPHHPGNKTPKGVNSAMHYELGRVQGMERGKRGPGPVGSHGRPEEYFENANTKHAQKVLRTHVGKDLRQSPVELPKQAHTPAPEATRLDQASQRASQAALQTHLKNVVKDFAVNIGERGYVAEHKDALVHAASESARLGEKMVPVNMSRLTRLPKEPLVPRAETRHGLHLANASERAWKQAVENHSNGKWVLMPERVVKRFVQHAESSRHHGAVQRSTNMFKDVVLTTANPVRWLGGNVTDLAMRSVLEGLTPADLYRGVRVNRELTKHGRKGTLVKASTTGGGFGHLARDVSREVSTPGAGHLAKVWHAYRSGVYGIESFIEALPQMATVGKEMRTGTGLSVRNGLKGLLRATDEQVQHFAKTMTTDPAKEMQVARHVEDVIGKWGKLSPEARKALAVAPFAQWLGAATKYTLITLPAKHPIKTGILSAINSMTMEERQQLGLSQYLPLAKQVQDYQMMTLPQSVGKDKYGPVVKGTDLARALSMGTVSDALDLNVGGYLFPQFSGALAAANGSSWTGEPLRYAEGTPNAGMELSAADRRKTAVGMLIEAMTPGAAMFRRVVQEKGRPSMPQSTILSPQVREKYDPKTKSLVTPKGSLMQGVKRATGAPIPGLPTPKRIYTKGAVNDMERSRTAIQEVKKWNARRKGHAISSGDAEVDRFGGPGHRKNKDAEVENFR